MPPGHTDTKTINARRALTPGMRDLLPIMIAAGGRYPEWKLDQRDKNIMRGLLDRGLVNWHIESRCYSVTDAGRAAIAAPR